MGSNTSERVRANVLVGPGRLEMRSFDVPEIGDDDGLLRVEACGICGSDIEQTRNLAPSRFKFPVIPGHEIVGVIERVGKRAAERWGARPGDRVCVEPILGCGSCSQCKKGRPLSCTANGFEGTPAYSQVSTSVPPSLWGGFAERLYLHRAAKIHRISPSVSVGQAALFNAMANGIEWGVRAPSLTAGDDVVVLGPGQRGLAAVVALRDAGAGRIVITGLRRDAHKLRVAEALGADIALVTEGLDTARLITDALDGSMADIVLDVTPGDTDSVLVALSVAKPGGRIILAGLKGDQVVPEFVSDVLIRKELSVRGVVSASSDAFAAAAALVSSNHEYLPLLHTHSFPLFAANDAIATLAGERGNGDQICISIQPGI